MLFFNNRRGNVDRALGTIGKTINALEQASRVNEENAVKSENNREYFQSLSELEGENAVKYEAERTRAEKIANNLRNLVS